MKTTLALALPALLLATPLPAQEVPLSVTASRTAIKAFAERLQAELVQAMENGGPAAAITVCNLKAPEIASAVSLDKGLDIGRTSLRTRNDANRPDEWEANVLQRFEARQAAGENPAELDYHEVVETDGRRLFRYMKAIPTAAVCLKCHGSDIDPEVRARLDELYPNDMARGFAVGDIRGAFTVSQQIP